MKPQAEDALVKSKHVQKATKSKRRRGLRGKNKDSDSDSDSDDSRKGEAHANVAVATVVGSLELPCRTVRICR